MLELRLELGERVRRRVASTCARKAAAAARRSSPRETGSGCRRACRARAGSRRRCRDRRAAAPAASWTCPAGATAAGSGRRSTRCTPAASSSADELRRQQPARSRSSRWCSRRRRLACKVGASGGLAWAAAAAKRPRSPCPAPPCCSSSPCCPPSSRPRPRMAQSEGSLRERIGSGKAQRALAGERRGAARAQLERKAGARGRRPRGPARRGAERARPQPTRGWPRPRSAWTRRAGACTACASGSPRSGSSSAALLRERYMGGPPGLRDRRPARRRLPAAARDAAVRAAASSAPTRACSTSSATRAGRRPRAHVADALAERRDREAAAARTRRDALAGITPACASARTLLAPRPRRPGRRARPRPRAAAARPSASSTAARRARPRARVSNGPGRPVGDPVADRAVRVRRPEPAAEPAPARPATTSSWTRPGGASAARRRRPTRPPRPSRTGSRRRLWAGGAGRHNWVCAVARGRLISRTGRRACSRRSPSRTSACSTRTSEPRVQPITFARVESTIVSAIDDKPKRGTPARVARLRAHPRAALTVDRYDADWTRLAWVQLLGDVTIEPVDRQALAALQARYPHYRDHPPPGPLLRLRPDKGSSAGAPASRLAPMRLTRRPRRFDPAAHAGRWRSPRTRRRPPLRTAQVRRAVRRRHRAARRRVAVEKVSHKGWPKITGILWQVTDSRDHERTRHRGQRRAARPPRRRQAASAATARTCCGATGTPRTTTTNQSDVLRGGDDNDFLYPSHGKNLLYGGAGQRPHHRLLRPRHDRLRAGQAGLRPDALAEQRLQGPQLRAHPALLRVRLKAQRRLQEARRERFQDARVSLPGLVSLLGRLVVGQRRGGVDVAERRVPRDQRLAPAARRSAWPAPTPAP